VQGTVTAASVLRFAEFSLLTWLFESNASKFHYWCGRGLLFCKTMVLERGAFFLLVNAILGGRLVAAATKGADEKTSWVLRLLQDYSSCDWTQRGEDINATEPSDNPGKVGAPDIRTFADIVALSADGLTLAAAFKRAARTDAHETFTHSRIKTYSFDPDTGLLTQLGNNIDGETATCYSALSLALSDDGRTVAIAAIWSEREYIFGPIIERGQQVRVYSYKNETDWSHLGEDIEGALDQTENNIALSADGKILAVGATFDDRSVRPLSRSLSTAWFSPPETHSMIWKLALFACSDLRLMVRVGCKWVRTSAQGLWTIFLDSP